VVRRHLGWVLGNRDHTVSSRECGRVLFPLSKRSVGPKPRLRSHFM
jgi:hypothetical protein